MIKDKLGSFCNGTALSLGSPAASPVIIGDYIDLEAHTDSWGTSRTPDIGEAGDLWINCKVTTLFASSGSPVITIALYHHTTASVASGAALASVTSVSKTAAAGTTLLRQKIPAGTTNRYLAMCATIASAAVTGGKIDAWIGDTGETPK